QSLRQQWSNCRAGTSGREPSYRQRTRSGCRIPVECRTELWFWLCSLVRWTIPQDHHVRARLRLPVRVLPIQLFKVRFSFSDHAEQVELSNGYTLADKL